MPPTSSKVASPSLAILQPAQPFRARSGTWLHSKKRHSSSVPSWAPRAMHQRRGEESGRMTPPPQKRDRAPVRRQGPGYRLGLHVRGLRVDERKSLFSGRDRTLTMATIRATWKSRGVPLDQFAAQHRPSRPWRLGTSRRSRSQPVPCAALGRATGQIFVCGWRP